MPNRTDTGIEPTGPDPAASVGSPHRSDEGAAESAPQPSEPPPSGPGSRGRWWARVLPLLWFALIAAATGLAHLQAARNPGAPVATLGEARLAVAALLERGLNLDVDALPLGDRLAANQLAVVQLLLPLDGVPVVDAARWAGLALGAVSALLIWPVLRGLGVSAPASTVGVGLLGVALPALTLHAGVTSGAPAAVWLLVAAWFAVREWGWAALIAALAAVLTAPLAAAALLALSAHLVLARMSPVPDRLRRPAAGLLGLASVLVAALSVGAGPLAGAAGPPVGTGATVAGVLAGLLVLGLTWRQVDWLRPVVTAAVPLLLVALVPGASRATAALLVAPVLAVAVGLLLDHLGDRRPGRVLAGLGVATLLLAVLAPTLTVLADRPPPPDPDALVSWLVSQPSPGTLVRADDLDRAELRQAGFPADRLRGPHDPVLPGELRLVAERPTADGPAAPTGCPGLSAVAAVAHGTGGAPGAVCRTDGAASAVAAELDRRTRLGTALAANPALRLSPDAAATLRAGQVDPRLMLVLAAMTTAHRIAVDDFPAVPLDEPTLPRRQALLTLIDDAAPASSELLRTWLTAQQPPFVPAVLEPAGPALLVGYPAPSPAGLLPE